MFSWIGAHAAHQSFTEKYRCYSISMLPGKERANLNHGGKIIMPPSALEKLASLNIVYPMLFQLNHARKERATHCGVLEFVAEEGRVYVPYWMMQQLLVEEGDLVVVKNVNLPMGSYVKLQPQSVDFLEIFDPKAVLENSLRAFACLTKGDVIALHYNKRIYELLVMETRPKDAISIIETDVEVEFAPPVGYVEPKKPPPLSKIEEPAPAIKNEPMGFRAFHGSGQRLSGKPLSTQPTDVRTSDPPSSTIIRYLTRTDSSI
jgi:ubiquitin fusion degradation protein 1